MPTCAASPKCCTCGAEPFTHSTTASDALESWRFFLAVSHLIEFLAAVVFTDLLFVLSLAVHEFGHAFAARRTELTVLQSMERLEKADRNTASSFAKLAQESPSMLSAWDLMIFQHIIQNPSRRLPNSYFAPSPMSAAHSENSKPAAWCD